jgi:hypothetical protein
MFKQHAQAALQSWLKCRFIDEMEWRVWGSNLGAVDVILKGSSFAYFTGIQKPQWIWWRNFRMELFKNIAKDKNMFCRELLCPAQTQQSLKSTGEVMKAKLTEKE